MEVSPNDQTLVRCCICGLFDPNGLGFWMKRSSIGGHLKTATHLEYERRKLEQEEAQRLVHAQLDMAYASAPTELPKASSIPPSIPPSHTIHTSNPTPPPMFHDSSDVVYMPPPEFDLAHHQNLIREEAENLWRSMEDELLGVADDEEDPDFVHHLEDMLEGLTSDDCE